MTYSELKNKWMQDELDILVKKHKVFFAFNQKQFKEGLKENNISKDEKLSSIVGGGIIPSKNVNNFVKDYDNLNNRFIEEVKKLDPKPIILYELGNYESWYTGDISSAWEVLKDYGYTKDQVLEVFKSRK